MISLIPFLVFSETSNDPRSAMDKQIYDEKTYPHTYDEDDDDADPFLGSTRAGRQLLGEPRGRGPGSSRLPSPLNAIKK